MLEVVNYEQACEKWEQPNDAALVTVIDTGENSGNEGVGDNGADDYGGQSG